jgi:hypothetical protein
MDDKLKEQLMAGLAGFAIAAVVTTVIGQLCCKGNKKDGNPK